jgi:hypothetical protein
MGLSPFLQDAGLNWLRGTAFPAPPAELWLALHSGTPAVEGNEVGGRVLVEVADLGTPRSGSREPLPQDPWVPGNGELREITNINVINSDLLVDGSRLVAFSFWDAFTGGTLLLRGRLQQEVSVFAGDVFTLKPGDLLIRFTSP